jgi:IS30 family transposase
MKRQEMIESRRTKVLDLHRKGLTVRAISDSLKIAKSTVQDDITFMRQEASDMISEYVQFYLTNGPKRLHPSIDYWKKQTESWLTSP